MSSSSTRYTESPTPEYRTSSTQRIPIPIHHQSNDSQYNFNEHSVANSSRLSDTTVQWISDPMTNGEKFRMKINIEGFNQNDVRVRPDGNRLFVYGERIENKSQGTSKKIIEKSYELPSDVDSTRPNVTFPSREIMQVDFPSVHRSVQYPQSRGYTSSQGVLSNLPIQMLPKESGASSRRIPIHRVSIFPPRSPTPGNQFFDSFDELNTRKPDTVRKQTIVETHRQRISPTTGTQASHSIHRHRSGSPILSDITEEDQYSSSASDGRRTPALLQHSTSSSSSVGESLHFPRDFNADVFYRSVFQPEITTDDHQRRYIEMKVDVHDYDPNDIKVTINDDDLIVQVEHTNFYKHVTLPSNIDSSSLKLRYHHDKKLFLTVRLLDAYSSFKYI